MATRKLRPARRRRRRNIVCCSRRGLQVNVGDVVVSIPPNTTTEIACHVTGRGLVVDRVRHFPPPPPNDATDIPF